MSIKLTPFQLGYIECALWSSTDDSCEPLDENFSINDIASETLQKMIQDCDNFYSINELGSIDEKDSKLGHDFWLTRNHHGAGFWDGDYPDELGKRLTQSSHEFGEVYLYSGDDGKIYQS